MILDNKDMLLLELLLKSEGLFEAKEESVPIEIRSEFLYFGLDKDRFPDSLIVRLHNLSIYGLVNEKYSNRWEITDAGKYKLEQVKKEVAQSDERKNLEVQKLRSENIKLVNELVDYNKIKIQRNVLFIISIISASLLLLKLIVEWQKQ